MDYIIWALVILAAGAGVLAAWRFFTLRSRGTSAIMRRLPAQGIHGWRHGSMRYHGNDLEYFKLRSISPMADLILTRLSVSLLNRRSPTSEEAAFISPDLRILTFRSKDTEYELALDTHGEMAFTAWLESAPDARHESNLKPSDFIKQQPRRDRR
ncbi:DUF2550 domain-containing protein [Corynebacterium pacaense]|uniref:DUF2550 domain-containing protein n=1 Tax=Corynebacterium pacaense TaxID=1816684 RepID=UPI0009BA71C8|nr:DUF2550 domain-containing protein [Corynebacterium pacaense]